MRHAKRIDEMDVFIDVSDKIKSLTASQRKFVQELVVRREETSAPAIKKKLLKKSFGVWAGRKDIEDSSEYVADLRKGWTKRLERLKN